MKNMSKADLRISGFSELSKQRDQNSVELEGSIIRDCKYLKLIFKALNNYLNFQVRLSYYNRDDDITKLPSASVYKLAISLLNDSIDSEDFRNLNSRARRPSFINDA